MKKTNTTENFISQRKYQKYITGVSLICLFFGFMLGSTFSPKQSQVDHTACREDYYYNIAVRSEGKIKSTKYDLVKVKHERDSLYRVIETYNKTNKSIIASLRQLKEEEPVIKKKVNVEDYALTILNNIPDPKVKSYVSKYYKIALEEQKHFGIPASLKLAQAMLESGYGSSKLAVNQNNHFGLKYWKPNYPKRIKTWDNLVDMSKVVTMNDDHPNDKFVGFKGVWHSYRYHSYFLAGDGSPYVKRLPNKENLTYKDWCSALKAGQRGGYATSKSYTRNILKIIEDNKLYEFDKIANL